MNVLLTVTGSRGEDANIYRNLFCRASALALQPRALGVPALRKTGSSPGMTAATDLPCDAQLEFTTRRLVKEPVYFGSEFSYRIPS